MPINKLHSGTDNNKYLKSFNSEQIWSLIFYYFLYNPLESAIFTFCIRKKKKFNENTHK